MRPIKFSTVFILFLSFFLLWACKPKEKKPVNPLDFAEYIVSYGPKSLSKMDNIFIGLEANKFKALSTELIEPAFNISPSVDGELTIQNNSIVFVPESNLSSDKEYVISLNLKNLVLIPKELKEKKFVFTLKTPPQNAQLTVKNLYTKNDIWKTKLKISLNDKETIEKLKTSLEITQDSKTLDFELFQNSPYQYNAEVNGLDMSKANSSVVFKLKKASLQMHDDVITKLELPDPDKFEMIKVVSDLDKSSFIFSKILDKSQNLNGLIKINGASKLPDYTIDGNRLIVFNKDRKQDAHKISISEKLRSNSGHVLAMAIEHENSMTPVIPIINNVGIGHILPSSNEVIFPFEAQGLRSVQLEIFKIYSNNLQQFYQQNSLKNYYGLEYVGETIYSEKLALKDLGQNFDPSTMNRYYFNLKDFISKDENAIYEIRLGFTPLDATLPCATELDYDPELSDKSIFESNYYGIAGRYEGFNWNDRDDPCKLGFYSSNKYTTKLILASNLGIIAKKASNGDIQVIVNDLVTSLPISGAEVSIFNKAQKELLITKTDKRGFVSVSNLEEAFLIKVKKNKDENWIRILNRDALSTSKFDVAGRTKKNGIDGYIYGERNIWRPGDSMYIDFVLFDAENKLPKDHPVKLVLENAQGKLVYSEKGTVHNGPIYPFIIPTKKDYITGDYIIHVNVGGNRFSKFVKIENIKPNKFAIQSTLKNIDISGYRNEILSSGKEFEYQVDWLYGAPAKNKRLQVELNVRNASTRFSAFSEFNFKDPKNTWSPPNAKIIADTKTNDTGKARVKLILDSKSNPQGMLQLKLKNTAYEDSGDFSVDAFSVAFSPFKSYTGISLPKDDYNYERVSKNKKVSIQLASVSEKGKGQVNRTLNVEIYRMENYWWYNNYNNEFDMTNMSSHVSQNKLERKTDSNGLAKFEVDFRTNGRYYINVCDEESGHCTGDYLYVGYAWDDDEMSSAQYEEAAQLNLSTVKSSYKLNETVELLVPSYFEGQALVSLENGDKIVESFWTQVRRGNNKITFTPQLEMFPTVYAHVSLLQEHASKANDMPIRLYGVVPINIEDETLKLNPEIKMVNELKPKQTFQIKVSEENNKEMYYTLALVEEGLLNISGFKTPDPFNHFYSRPSLGVRTFDMYNEVLSAYGTELSGLLSIGGDMENVNSDKDVRANRFKPVVHHIGPFFLGSGAKKTHEITLPNYIGSVRVMLVAANQNSFGNSEKQVPVKQDLMLLATLPRTLSPGDEMDMPLTLFTLKENVGKVDYGVEMQGQYLNFEPENNSIFINDIDEKMEKMKFRVNDKEGIAKLGFFAKSGGILATQELEIDVRNPNPIIRRSETKYLDPGASFEWMMNPLGTKSNLITSVSVLAPINVEDHLNRLSQYPYGCLEQRTSAALAYLFKPDLLEMDEVSKNYAKTIVNDLLDDLYRFEHSNGYGLWPSSRVYNDWLTSYVGEFIYSAKAKGFYVSESTLEFWKSKQSSLASSWLNSEKNSVGLRRSSILQQAYRLYTLALNGDARINEMNRLQEDNVLEGNSRLLLAAAYAKSGRGDLATSLLGNSSEDEITSTNFDRATYHSYPRNLALQIILYDQLGEKEKVASISKTLNQWLSNNNYMSTHTTSFVIRAMCIMAKNFGSDKNIQIKYSADGKAQSSLSSETGLIAVNSALNNPSKISIENTSSKGLYVQLTRSGKEKLGEEIAASSQLKINTQYFDMRGNMLDPKSIEQGVDFKVRTTITRPQIKSNRYSDLALRQIFPSGWEISNNRIFDINSDASSALDYQDYQDNQVNSFFSLQYKESIIVEVLVKATYQGSYYHPKMICESMYEDDIYAEKEGFACVVY